MPTSAWTARELAALEMVHVRGLARKVAQVQGSWGLWSVPCPDLTWPLPVYPFTNYQLVQGRASLAKSRWLHPPQLTHAEG